MARNLSFPKSVTIFDVTLREGLESEEFFVPTAAKLFIAGRLVDAGLKCLEVGNFAPPFAVQFKDTDDVLKGLPRRPDLTYSCNFYAERAESLKHAKENGYNPDLISIHWVTTEASVHHLYASTISERMKLIEKSIQMAHDLKMKVQVNIVNTWFDGFDGKLKCTLTKDKMTKWSSFLPR